MAILPPFAALACWVAHQAEQIWSEKDCSKIVIDEWTGFLVTMAGIVPTWGTVIAGFLIFRLVDIIKPFPIRWLERRIHGGAGVVIDDVLAGVYASILMNAGRHWI